MISRTTRKVAARACVSFFAGNERNYKKKSMNYIKGSLSVVREGLRSCWGEVL
jgi:hypothetical protein